MSAGWISWCLIYCPKLFPPSSMLTWLCFGQNFSSSSIALSCDTPWSPTELPGVSNQMPSSKSCRKCREAAVCAVGMVIPEHRFNPADHIHRVQQDGFRLCRDLRPTLRSVLGGQAELSWNQEFPRNSVELHNKLQFNQNKLAAATRQDYQKILEAFRSSR